MKKIFLFLLCATLLLVPGCGKPVDTPEPVLATTVQYATAEPDSLTAVLDVLYRDIEIKGLADADATAMTELFHMEPGWMSGYAARFSDGRYGVADIVIIKPIPGHEEDITAALEIRRSERIAEFENYDVHDALGISKNAEIFERGNYIILLMVADSEAAHTAILEQIPG